MLAGVNLTGDDEANVLTGNELGRTLLLVAVATIRWSGAPMADNLIGGSGGTDTLKGGPGG